MRLGGRLCGICCTGRIAKGSCEWLVVSECNGNDARRLWVVVRELVGRWDRYEAKVAGNDFRKVGCTLA
jgi:hypothetical protein